MWWKFSHIFLCCAAPQHLAILWIWKRLQFIKLSAHELSAVCDKFITSHNGYQIPIRRNFLFSPYWKETEKKWLKNNGYGKLFGGNDTMGLDREVLTQMNRLICAKPRLTWKMWNNSNNHVLISAERIQKWWHFNHFDFKSAHNRIIPIFIAFGLLGMPGEPQWRKKSLN